MPYLYNSFPQKGSVIGGSFAENDLQLIMHPLHLRHPVNNEGFSDTGFSDWSLLMSIGLF